MERETVSEWAETVMALQRTYHETDQHLRVFYTFDADLLPTPYLVMRSISVLSSADPDLKLSIAAVIPTRILMNSSQHVVTHVYNGRSIHLVESVDEANAWLNERHRKFQQRLPLDE
ncbi:MAG: hypothetical protein CL607_22985 [Anaerolineaceae bacterium]|nr:hypothetical protein [Anaerolineaceae bacterium]